MNGEWHNETFASKTGKRGITATSGNGVIRLVLVLENWNTYVIEYTGTASSDGTDYSGIDCLLLFLVTHQNIY